MEACVNVSGVSGGVGLGGRPLLLDESRSRASLKRPQHQGAELFARFSRRMWAIAVIGRRRKAGYTLYLLLHGRGGSRLGTITLPSDQNGPDDARQFGRQGAGHDIAVPSSL